MVRILALLFIVFSTPAFSQTTLVKSFMHGGISRDYRIYIPASYTGSTSVPLLLNLHGYGSDATQQEAYGDFRAIADTANFIIAHPNGTFDGSFKRYWNSYGFTTVDDLGFLSALIDTVDALYNIDLDRVYSTGMSNGGIMSYFLSCNLSSRITAVASVTGSMTYAMKSACGANHPTPTMQIHGTADAVVPYSGNSAFIPMDSVISYWVNYNACNSSAVLTNVPNTNTTDGCTATRYDYTNGTSGSKVAFYKITGGGHSWPGAPVDIAVTNHDFEASIEIWKFFRPYKLSLLTSTDRTGTESNDFTVYPNPSEGELTIQLKGTPGNSKLEILDLNGRVISTHAITDLLKLDISEVPSGIYLVAITSEKTRIVKKFTKS